MSAVAGATAITTVSAGSQRVVPLHPGVPDRAPRTPLALVPAHRTSPPLAPYVTLVLGLLAAGLLALLLLNTVLGQDAFRLYDLQSSTRTLTEDEQVLRQEVDRLQSPGRLADAARGLGMVPAPAPVFLRLSDGAVLGTPTPAPTPPPAPAPVVPAAAAPATAAR